MSSVIDGQVQPLAMTNSHQRQGAAIGEGAPGLKTTADAAAAARKLQRAELLREDLNPQSFRTDYGQALVACFELVNESLSIARDTERLLLLAAHGEHGLVNQVKKVIAQAHKKVQSATDGTLEKFKTDLACAASETLESMVDLMQLLRDESKQVAQHRQLNADLFVQLSALQKEIQSSVQVLAHEREQLSILKQTRKSWFARLLNQ